MKKIALFSSVFLLTCISLKAQIEFKPQAGLNFSNVTDSPEGIENKAKIGYQFGLSAIIGNRLYISPGVEYFATSTEFSNPSNVEFDSDQKISGIRVPLMIGFRFVPADEEPLFNGRIFAGPTFTYITNAELTNENVDDQVEWKDTRFAGQLGLGIDIDFFFIEGAYEFGFTNNYDSNVDNVEGTVEGFDNIKNNTFLVTAGLRFTLGN